MTIAPPFVMIESAKLKPVKPAFFSFAGDKRTIKKEQLAGVRPVGGYAPGAPGPPSRRLSSGCQTLLCGSLKRSSGAEAPVVFRPCPHAA